MTLRKLQTPARSCAALLAFAKDHDVIAHNDISDSVAKLIANLGHFCEARGTGLHCARPARRQIVGDRVGSSTSLHAVTAKLTLVPKSAVSKKKRVI